MSCSTLKSALSSELILHANDIETLKQLLINGADINYQSKEGWCLLFELISLGLDKNITQLKNLGMSFDIIDSKNRTALFWAMHYEDEDVIAILINEGYDLSKPVTDVLPALHYAVYKNNTAIVNLLLKHNYDIESKDTYDNTALSYAYHYKNETMIALLKQRGACTATLDY